MHCAKRTFSSWTLSRDQIDQINSGIRLSRRNLAVYASVCSPAFASVTGGSSTSIFLLFTRAMASFLKLYLLLLFVRVLLTWFPQFDWEAQPWLTLREITDPYLNLFRGFIPPLLGQIDLTPLLGFYVLQFLAGALEVGEMDDDW
ncbi:unnamed protein product [Pedinophyceae sp. YPF-701]|nr:unnamed protein product [Pedinophyceae sp. YPF-701]